MNKTSYVRFADLDLTKRKKLVISKVETGGYSLAQEIKVIDDETGNTINMFLKGAIFIKDKEKLALLRDLIDSVLETEDEENWNEEEEE